MVPESTWRRLRTYLIPLVFVLGGVGLVGYNTGCAGSGEEIRGQWIQNLEELERTSGVIDVEIENVRSLIDDLIAQIDALEDDPNAQGAIQELRGYLAEANTKLDQLLEEKALVDPQITALRERIENIDVEGLSGTTVGLQATSEALKTGGALLPPPFDIWLTGAGLVLAGVADGFRRREKTARVRAETDAEFIKDELQDVDHAFEGLIGSIEAVKDELDDDERKKMLKTLRVSNDTLTERKVREKRRVLD